MTRPPERREGEGHTSAPDPVPPPAPTRPPDFEAFWKKTRAELGQVAPNVSREPLGSEDGPLRSERLVFGSLGGARVSGYVIRHEDGAPRPLVVHGHGYDGDLEAMWRWARAGLNVVGVEARGYGRSGDALPEPSPWGYVMTGKIGRASCRERV